ncbi:hypothetical protein KW790_01525 [Candidatus Parcubacteria bacterium]|nr:hypothetical protein [Candidatus Parcubacteria bacterium]
MEMDTPLEVSVELEEDLKCMSKEELAQELMRVRGLIRMHKRMEDNDRCWHNDAVLYDRVLPEGSEGRGRMDLPEGVLMRNCLRYIRGQKCERYKCVVPPAK